MRARAPWASTTSSCTTALIESLPLAGCLVDVVISNGVIDLVPDKDAVLDEIDRVLRPAADCSSPTWSSTTRSPRTRARASISGPAESRARCSTASTRACWCSGPTPTSPRATWWTPTLARRSRRPVARRRSSARWAPRSGPPSRAGASGAGPTQARSGCRSRGRRRRRCSRRRRPSSRGRAWRRRRARPCGWTPSPAWTGASYGLQGSDRRLAQHGRVEDDGTEERRGARERSRRGSVAVVTGVPLEACGDSSACRLRPRRFVRSDPGSRRCAYEAMMSRCRSVWTARPPDRGRWSATVSSSSAASHGVR